jgi:eukaryotic-like serine/threonine-protein kinase
VALYEGLYGERPFGGPSLETLRDAVVLGRVAEPPPDSDVPAWVRRILLVGLAPDPAARWHSMAALLDALERDPRAARRRILTAAAVVAVAAAGVIIAYRQGTGSPARLCRGAEERWRGIWDTDRRATMRQAFLATGKPYAEAAWTGTAEFLDAYTASWAAMRGEACEATRVRGEQPESVLALRMACLDRSQTEVSSLTAAYAAADSEVVENAVAAARFLPDLRHCADTASLLAENPLPGDPIARDLVERLRRQIDQTRAMSRTRTINEALPRANMILIAALTVRHRPLEAEAYMLLAEVVNTRGEYLKSEKLYENAALAAEAGGADQLAAKAWIEVFQMQASRGTDKAETERTNRLTAAAIERAGRDDDLVARHLEALGELAQNAKNEEKALAYAQETLAIVARIERPEGLKTANALLSMAHAYHEMGKLDLAEEAFKRALAIREDRLGRDHPNVGVIVSALATLYGTAGRYDEANAHFERALRIQEGSLGPDHPSLATPLANWSFTLLEQEKYDQAQATSERAERLLEKAYGPRHPRVAVALGALGNVHAARGDTATARKHLDRALSIAEETLGGDHAMVAGLLTAIAGLDQLESKDADGVARYERALGIYYKVYGEDNPNVAVTLANLGALHLVSERAAQAFDVFQKALAIDERVLGPDHPGVAYDLSGMGRAKLALGRPREALPLLERALAIREKAGVGTVETADAQFGLAQALWRTGGDRKRARKLAESAIALYEEDADPLAKESAKDTRAWLRAPK